MLKRQELDCRLGGLVWLGRKRVLKGNCTGHRGVGAKERRSIDEAP